MSHPFNLGLTELQLLDLEFEQSFISEDIPPIEGGTRFVTRALGETGADCSPRPYPRPVLPRPIHLPGVTTMALGEEGGCWNPPQVTTMAVGEEGGCFPR